MKLGPKSKAFSVLIRKDQETVSNAFSKSRNNATPGLIQFLVKSKISIIFRDVARDIAARGKGWK